MQRSDKIRLKHILDESLEIRRFVKGINFADFEKDNKTVHAVLRAIEIIGEAAGKISSDYKDKHDEIPWSQIVGMRNHLIHVYFDVDYETIWKTIQGDIPKLAASVKALLKEK